MLSIIDIIEDTTVDGPGFRTAIYAAGCPNQCPGCHNPESWDIKKGRPTPTEDILEKVLEDEFADVTFSGGDPMYQPEGFTELARATKRKAKRISGVTPDISSRNYWKTLNRRLAPIHRCPGRRKIQTSPPRRKSSVPWQQ